MTRILFFLTALVAMVAALLAGAIRLELATPGVTLYFVDANGVQDGARFGAVSATHALFGYLAVMLLGTTMIAAARERGARLAGLFMWLGVLTCALTALLIASSELPLHWFVADAANREDIGAGWTLYPPLATPNQHSLLTYLTSFVIPAVSFLDPAFMDFTDPGRYLLLPAGVLLYLGAFALLSTERGFSWIGVIGAILLLAVATLTAPIMLEAGMSFLVVGWLLPALILLACGSIRLLDDDPAWLLVLILGTLIMVLAYSAVLVHPLTLMAAGTMAEIAVVYVFPLGLAWFALPALILYRSGTRLTDTALWGICAGLTAGLIFWLGPMFHAGHHGQPYRYVDYPNAFSAANRTTSVGVFVFAAVMLAVIVILRRNRA